jgi:hypothetical protein
MNWTPCNILYCSKVLVEIALVERQKKAGEFFVVVESRQDFGRFS